MNDVVERVAREPDYVAERKLPAGTTCADCRHGKRCDGLFGAVRRGFTSCDFWPSRFVAALADASPDIGKVVANTLAAHRLAALEEAKGRNAPIGMALGLIAYITGLPEELRWTPEFTRYVSERADEIATAIRALPTFRTEPQEPTL